MNTGDLNKVWEIKALKKKVGEDEARKILEKVAKQVQPIMRKHKWRVKILSEFCPKNPALLGLNVGGGVHVKLRLRRPNRDWDFIPFNQVLDTMLHELCHNAHGPHNTSFYKLWDELRKECEELMMMGITGTGEGFDLPGKRLGGFSRQPPLSSLCKTALAAAENRARLGSLLPSGPKRLGGDCSIMGALSPIQAAAMAAERRLQDDIWCGLEEVEDEAESSTDILQKHVVQRVRNSRSCSRLDVDSDAKSLKRIRTSTISLPSQSCNSHAGSSFVDLTVEASTSASIVDNNVPTQRRSPQRDTKSLSRSLNGSPKSAFVDLSAGGSSSGCNQNTTCNAEESSMWECAVCTLLNPPLAPMCELCDTQKPKDVKDKYKIWSCKFCTLESSVKIEKCTACGQWRYSHGAPVAAPAPNVGT